MALGNGAEMRNVMALTSKQRAYLGGCASTMDPIFHIGKASLTPEIITALDEALEKRELIKVAVLKNCIDDPREIVFYVNIPCLLCYVLNIYIRLSASLVFSVYVNGTMAYDRMHM